MRDANELPQLSYFEHTRLGCYISATLCGLACCVGSYNSQVALHHAAAKGTKGYLVLSGVCLCVCK